MRLLPKDRTNRRRCRRPWTAERQSQRRRTQSGKSPCDSRLLRCKRSASARNASSRSCKLHEFCERLTANDNCKKCWWIFGLTISMCFPAKGPIAGCSSLMIVTPSAHTLWESFMICWWPLLRVRQCFSISTTFKASVRTCRSAQRRGQMAVHSRASLGGRGNGAEAASNERRRRDPGTSPDRTDLPQRPANAATTTARNQ